MNKKTNLCYVNRKLHTAMLSKIKVLETEVKRLKKELSEVKTQISSPSSKIDALIDSLEKSSKDLYEQSEAHREYVERSINGKSCLRIIRRMDDEY